MFSRLTRAVGAAIGAAVIVAAPLSAAADGGDELPSRPAEKSLSEYELVRPELPGRGSDSARADAPSADAALAG